MELSKMISIGLKAVKVFSAVENANVASLFNGILPEEGEGGKVGEFIQKCFESGNVDSLKKYLIVAKSIANKNGGIIQPIGQVVSSIDDAVEILKAAYDVATGRVDAHVAADRIVDRITLRAVTVVETYIDNDLPLLVDGVCDAITAYYPPFAAVAPFVKQIVTKLTPEIKKVVEKGIKKLGEVAKPILAKVIQGVQERAQKVSSKIRSFVKA